MYTFLLATGNLAVQANSDFWEYTTRRTREASMGNVKQNTYRSRELNGNAEKLRQLINCEVDLERKDKRLILYEVLLLEAMHYKLITTTINSFEASEEDDDIECDQTSNLLHVLSFVAQISSQRMEILASSS